MEARCKEIMICNRVKKITARYRKRETIENRNSQRTVDKISVQEIRSSATEKRRRIISFIIVNM
jgi:hypothetical protein